jgi:16S rRNA (cytosine1402-N4)-methyltransferase
MDGRRPDARDVVNKASAEDLAAIFKAYGEERHAGRIARALVEERERAPIETTKQLADVIEAAAPHRSQEKIHPGTRVFQALRIFVNDELGQLASGLLAAERLLRPAGRLVVIAFHSLEDRIVKRFLAGRIAERPSPSRHAPPAPAPPATFRLLHGKPLTPQAAEIADNPRARSARLRAAVRLDAQPSEETGFAPSSLSLSAALSEWR